jgi:hypothetical protein
MDPAALPWRIGRYPHRSIYTQAGDKLGADDVLVGSVQTAVLAALVVEQHNANLADLYTDTY